MPFDIAALREFFFDQPKIMAAVQKAKKRSLSAQGAFIRKSARSSIRKSKKSAVPGQPPKSHKGTLRLIFFVWDPNTESVVVGPVKVTSKEGRIVPKLLEEGGEARRRVSVIVPDAMKRPTTEAQRAAFKRKVKDGSIVPKGREKKYELVHYHEFPYMAPAAVKGMADFAEKFKDSVK